MVRKSLVGPIKNILPILVLSLALPALAGDKAPLPAKLVNAKTAFVFNDGTWVKVYDKFYNELKKWNRFQLVESKDEADIVIALSNRPGSTTVGVATVGTSSGVVVGGSESKFYIYITDAKDGTPLWSDSTGETLLVSNSAKKLVKRLRKRMPEN
jgi:hypothetical protein